jgi:hypothetical protein
MGSQKHTASIVNNMGQEVNNKGRKVKFMGLKFNNMAGNSKSGTVGGQYRGLGGL